MPETVADQRKRTVCLRQRTRASRTFGSASHLRTCLRDIICMLFARTCPEMCEFHIGCMLPSRVLFAQQGHKTLYDIVAQHTQLRPRLPGTCRTCIVCTPLGLADCCSDLPGRQSSRSILWRLARRTCRPDRACLCTTLGCYTLCQTDTVNTLIDHRRVGIVQCCRRGMLAKLPTNTCRQDMQDKCQPAHMPLAHQ